MINGELVNTIVGITLGILTLVGTSWWRSETRVNLAKKEAADGRKILHERIETVLLEVKNEYVRKDVMEVLTDRMHADLNNLSRAITDLKTDVRALTEIMRNGKPKDR